MRFLFALRTPGDARPLRSTLQSLADQGHEIVLVIDEGVPEAGTVSTFIADTPNVSARDGVGRVRQADRDLGRALRSWLDYLWFFEDELASASRLRERAGKLVPRTVRDATDAVAGDRDVRRVLAASIGALEQALPVPPQHRTIVEAEHPDVVAVSPLVRRGSPQANFLKAARELGVKTAYCVAGWDNLTTKGIVHGFPDLVTVWNRAQERELVELHRIDPTRIAITGAPLYDEWFDREPRTTREEFCDRAGLSSAGPFILYACSSGFVAPAEAEWIVRWLELVRGSGHSALADVPVLIRPHPANRLLDGTDEAEALTRLPGVAIHPTQGVFVGSEQELAEYYDALFHSAAVVGINTSALIEAALVGRGVYVLLADPYRGTQTELPHFAHLRQAGGGLIGATVDPEAHAAALARAVSGEDAAEAEGRARAFLADFIRPHGLNEPATPRMVSALEELAARPGAEPVRGPAPEWLEAVVADLEQTFRVRSRGRMKKRGKLA
jgi:hypothetical protein